MRSSVVLVIHADGLQHDGTLILIRRSESAVPALLQEKPKCRDEFALRLPLVRMGLVVVEEV